MYFDYCLVVVGSNGVALVVYSIWDVFLRRGVNDEYVIVDSDVSCHVFGMFGNVNGYWFGVVCWFDCEFE